MGEVVEHGRKLGLGPNLAAQETPNARVKTRRVVRGLACAKALMKREETKAAMGLKVKVKGACRVIRWNIRRN